jgi:thiol-disulfide isomerase/thioredoxin
MHAPTIEVNVRFNRFSVVAAVAALLMTSLVGCTDRPKTKAAAEPTAQSPSGEESTDVSERSQKTVAQAGEQPAAGAPDQPEPKAEPNVANPAPGPEPDPENNAGDDPFPRKTPAPPLSGGEEWLNTAEPITLESLRGKVVLLDFWTYCCINCIHVLPDLKKLEEKYANQLVVIGVHSAKFDTEKDSQNIREAILRYEIKHPVVNDSRMSIWRRYGVRGWPTLVLIDPEGNVLGGESGEGLHDLFDEVIAGVIKHHRAKGTLKEGPVVFDLEENRVKDTPLRFPGKVVVDAATDRLFISDSNHNRIVIATLAGKVVDVVGTGAIGRADGPYDTATFFRPQGMALDGDSLYVADTENHMLRRVDLKARTVSTVSGTGQQGRSRSHAPMPAKTTALNSPWDLWMHEGKLFIAMAGPHQIWVWDSKADEIHAFAGSGREDILDGEAEVAALAQPSGLASDGERLFVADSEVSGIRTVTIANGDVATVVGMGLFEFGDVDGEKDEVRLQHPLGVAWHDGVLYVADTYNNKIKAIDPKNRTSTTFLGDGSPGDSNDPPRFDEPSGLAIAGGKMYIADTNTHQIRVVDMATKTVTTLQLDGLSVPIRSNATR